MANVAVSHLVARRVLGEVLWNRMSGVFVTVSTLFVWKLQWKLRKLTFEEVCFLVQELSEGRAEALQRRRDAHHGRLSSNPRSGVLSVS